MITLAATLTIAKVILNHLLLVILTYNTNNNANARTHQQPRGIVVPKSEFDFSQSNAKFSKEEIAINDSAAVEEPAAPSYNKNLSFFDDISCQANTESTRQPDRNRNERNLNMETFGQAAPAS